MNILSSSVQLQESAASFVLLGARNSLALNAFYTKSNAISGTGSAAMEAAVANMVEPGDNVLVCTNGYFSLRIADMARRYCGNVQIISRPWGEVFTAEEVDTALQMHPAKVVAIVHAETSTGALQPLEDIVRVVHGHGAYLIVDAVTSLGGIPVSVDLRQIDVCYSVA